MTDPSAPGGVPEFDLSGTTVLLVDDNLQNLELMEAYLESLPCTIQTARDGMEALSQIEQNPPDLILLDVMMPRMSGFEVCQKIKTAPRTRDIPVIMVTALHEVGDVERAVESGANDFLSKPVNKLELLTRVRSLLSFRLLKQQWDRMMTQGGGSGGPAWQEIRSRLEAGEKLEGEVGRPGQAEPDDLEDDDRL